MKAFSFEIRGDMGFFKKNDGNDIVQTTYNFIHKPAVLGIFGAILGFKGYYRVDRKDYLEYYEKLKRFKIAIIPGYKKPLKKTLVKYNNSSGLASEEIGGVLQVEEQVIIEPLSFKIIVPLIDSFSNEEIKIFSNLENMIKNNYSEFPIYFGKNEFLAYFQGYRSVVLEKVSDDMGYISSLVRKSEVEILYDSGFGLFEDTEEKTTIFEELPYDFDESGMYKKDIFVLTENKVKIKNTSNFWRINNEFVYIF